MHYSFARPKNCSVPLHGECAHGGDIYFGDTGTAVTALALCYRVASAVAATPDAAAGAGVKAEAEGGAIGASRSLNDPDLYLDRVLGTTVSSGSGSSNRPVSEIKEPPSCRESAQGD